MQRHHSTAKLCLGFGALLLAVSLTPRGLAQSQPSAGQRQAEAEINRLQQDWLAALLKGDAAPLQRIFADDYIAATEAGAVVNKAQVIASIRPAPAAATPPQVAVSESRLRFYGATAISTGLLSVKTPVENTGLRYTIVLNKQSGQWQVSGSHVSRVNASVTNAKQFEQELDQLAAEWVEALKQGDVAALDRIYAADFVGTNTAGIVFNREQLKGLLRNGGLKYALIEGTDRRTRLEGNLAVVNVLVTAKGTSQGQAFSSRTRSTHTLVRRQGRWQVLASTAVQLPQ